MKALNVRFKCLSVQKLWYKQHLVTCLTCLTCLHCVMTDQEEGGILRTVGLKSNCSVAEAFTSSFKEQVEQVALLKIKSLVTQSKAAYREWARHFLHVSLTWARFTCHGSDEMCGYTFITIRFNLQMATRSDLKKNKHFPAADYIRAVNIGLFLARKGSVVRSAPLSAKQTEKAE